MVITLAAFVLAMVPMLALACAVSWVGHGGPLDPSEDPGCWDEVLASLAVTTLAGARVEHDRARADLRNAKARLRRAQWATTWDGDRWDRAHADVQRLAPLAAAWGAILRDFRSHWDAVEGGAS